MQHQPSETAHDPRFFLSAGAGTSACERCQGPHPTQDCPENEPVELSGYFLDDGNKEPLSEQELKMLGMPEALYQ